MQQKIVTTIILGLFLISCISAINITAGDSYSFESEQFDYWNVVGNSSDLTGCDISWENGNTTISFDLLYKTDLFTLIFFNKEGETIIEHHYSGGGGGTRTKYVYENNTITEYINKTIEIPIKDNDEINKLNDKIKDIEDKLTKERLLSIFLFSCLIVSSLVTTIFLKKIFTKKLKGGAKCP